MLASVLIGSSGHNPAQLQSYMYLFGIVSLNSVGLASKLYMHRTGMHVSLTSMNIKCLTLATLWVSHHPQPLGVLNLLKPLQWIAPDSIIYHRLYFVCYIQHRNRNSFLSTILCSSTTTQTFLSTYLTQRTIVISVFVSARIIINRFNPPAIPHICQHLSLSSWHPMQQQTNKKRWWWWFWAGLKWNLSQLKSVRLARRS